MPKELRRIVFSHAEATDAIISYGAKFNMTFPHGRVIRAAFAGQTDYDFHSLKGAKNTVNRQYNVEDKSRAVIVTFFEEKTLEHKYLNLTSDFISAALIEYCVSHKVPLPKPGSKILDLTEFNLVLDVNLAQGEDAPTSLTLAD